MVKKIELTKGQHAIVDDEHFDFLNEWKWYAHYFPRLNGYYAERKQSVYYNGKRKQETVYMHRAIMERILGRELKRKEVVDHKNQAPLDNRHENLRVASMRQNMQNLKSKTTSNYPGVSWKKNANKWEAYIKLNGKQKHLGLFVNELDAAKAYEQACRELAGEELICKA